MNQGKSGRLYGDNVESGVNKRVLIKSIRPRTMGCPLFSRRTAEWC